MINFYIPLIVGLMTQFGEAADSSRLRNGVWGGDQLRMTVTNKNVEFKWDCAHGLIDHSVTLVDGLMNEQGTVVGEGGPESPDDPRPVFKADFSGVPDGDTFPIQITIYMAGTATSRVYRLRYGQEPMLNQCL